VEEFLLIVLAVDVAEVRCELPEKRGGDGAAAEKGAGLAGGLDFAFQQQLAVFDFDAVGFHEIEEGGGLGGFKDACDAGLFGSGADHVGRSAATVEETEGVHKDGLAAAGFAGEQVETFMEANAEPLDDGVVFDDELQEHSS